jgi:hypothetical protein
LAASKTERIFCATQSVDMISSLRYEFGRVEVAVLNIDLLPNVKDIVVIDDRMFALSIQVEGRDDVDPNDIHMEEDAGDNGARQEDGNGGAEPHNGRSDQPKEMKDKTPASTHHSDKQNDKPTKALLEMNDSYMTDTSSALNPE